jgi:hypothetical protein
VSDELEIKTDKVAIETALELLKLLISKPDLANLEECKIWGVFESYFSTMLKKSETDPFVCCLSLIDSLKSTNIDSLLPNLHSIISLFIGKLPSLSNTDRTNKERLQVSDILQQSLKIHQVLVPSIFESIVIKHLNCDLTMIMDYFTVLYHENGEDAILRIQSLLFLQRTLNHISDLALRTQLLATHFPTFLVALQDPNEQ